MKCRRHGFMHSRRHFLQIQKRIAEVFLFIFFFIVLNGIVFARVEKQREGEDSQKRQVHLSIEEALELALKNNRDLQTARRSLKSVESNYRRAKAEYYPHLTGDIKASHTAYNQLDIDPAIQNSYNGGIGINFSLPLDLPGTIGRSLQQAHISLINSQTDYVSSCQKTNSKDYFIR